MKNLFSYDSKLMIMLEGVANTMLLNLLFLLFCLPVFTIGAAFTALYSGCRALINDEPCFRAFMRGFRSGFKRATLAWIILFVWVVVMALSAHSVWLYMNAGMAFGAFTLVVALIAVVFGLAVTTMTFLLYSRFECTLFQMLKNGVYMTLAYPVRAIFMGLGNWLPVLLFFLAPYEFMRLSVVAVFLYFAVAANVSVWLMKKPFAQLEERVRGEE